MTFIDYSTPTWDEMRHQLRDVGVTLTPYRVATPEDVDDHVLSKLTYGLIPSQFMPKLETGELVYSVDPERRGILETIGFELGFYTEISDTPRHLWPVPIDWNFVRDSLNREVVSPELVLVWGRLNYLVGRYKELVFNSDRAAKEVEQAIAGKINSTIVQECWFAHWVSANTKSLKGRERTRAQRELAKLCWDIHRGQLKPWDPYLKLWFSSMLEVEKEGKAKKVLEGLKTTYTRIKTDRIRELLKHPKITSAVLPPLSPGEFRRTARVH